MTTATLSTASTATPSTEWAPGPANPTAAFTAAWARLEPVFAEIKAAAAERDSAGELAFDAVEQLKEAGYTTLRVPTEYGGAGLSFEEASWFLVALGQADSNLAQALRAHWINVEDVLHRPASQQDYRHRWLTRLGAGATVGFALTENNNVRGETTTRLHTLDTGVRVLNGTKYYSTGAAYADWLLVSATDDDGNPVSLAVESRAEGTQLIDDWDGFGQQLTASGTTIFSNTPVRPEEIAPPGEGFDSGARVAFGQALAQYVHLATLVGIGQAVVDDGAEYVRLRARGFSHGNGDLPRFDPQVLQVVGGLSSAIFGARAAFTVVLPELARHLAADAADEVLPEAEVDRLYLAVYQAQQVIAKAVLGAATELFEVGGASATSQTRALDRHWRNARVLANHNPLIYRARIIGDWEVNGTAVERSYEIGTPPATPAQPAAGVQQ